MNKILKVVFVIIAALIGAGFASGQEISVFFYSYGKQGLLGLIMCSVLFSYIIYKTFKILQKNEIESYKDLVYTLVGGSGKRKYLNVGFVINTIVNIFLMITFFIMLAGFGAYFGQEMKISNYIGSGVLAVLCFITLMSNVNGVVKISSFLVPILIMFIIIIGSININSINVASVVENMEQTDGYGWILSSILYCSYNSILLIPVLITLKRYMKKRNTILTVAILSAVITLILAVAIYFLLARVDIDINKLEMPVVYVISQFFSGFKIVYAFIILASIYTTAISIGVSFLDNVAQSKRAYTLIAAFICVTGFIVSGFGFSNLVTLLYPIFGYLGLIQIGALLLYYK